jgi:enoyl-[acyl-carrier protein] reductase I
MSLLTGKRGLIVGVANDYSYAYFIAEALLREGAECLFTHLPGDRMARRVGRALDQLGIADPWLRSMDAGSDEELDRVFTEIGSEFGSIDFVVHSIAYADRDWLKVGAFTDTPRQAFLQAMDISAYTFMAMASRAAHLMPDGGSMVSMSYYGAEKAVPAYNVMGVAKSALESITRYLAADLGPKNVRVNSISGGPLRTMSALAVGDFNRIQEWVAQKSPLGRNVTGADVGNAAAFLLSEHAAGITGEVVHVDCGYSVVGI